ncbi:hypothetical protein NE237_022267 [Protea cynaroides]|uniref:Amino acid transporter transmembrane domain-containing protein n=1 Tax=Protea cynaroides TaxID=273540 RepID=A0A9Q0K5N3_9MAGN|nr:hypothetical protein NE237_022267 [Protea cynaroides]
MVEANCILEGGSKSQSEFAIWVPPTETLNTQRTTPPRLISPPPTPLSSPIPVSVPVLGKMAIVPTMQDCQELQELVLDDEEQVGHNSQKKLNPMDDWLPITESRNGNVFSSAFHCLNSGIGFQALLLPLAFTVLGWTWGIVCMSLAFGWQLYTLWLLTQLHESVTGTRYSRYLHLAKAAFGQKKGKLMALLPIMYLSGGTCVALITLGGGSMKFFFHIVCTGACLADTLTTVEWFLVFTVCAIVLAQLPNLNSIVSVSVIGAITALIYCTMIWVVSIAHGRVASASYEPLLPSTSSTAEAFSIVNALGIIGFAFRGHNLLLEIQGTMPSTLKHPSQVPMWRGVKFAYLLIAVCLYSLAIGGYWTYGNLKPDRYTAMWIINWGLGILGMAFSFLVIAGAVWNIVDKEGLPNELLKLARQHHPSFSAKRRQCHPSKISISIFAYVSDSSDVEENHPSVSESSKRSSKYEEEEEDDDHDAQAPLNEHNLESDPNLRSSGGSG